MSNPLDEGFGSVLNEAADVFHESGFNIYGDGFKDIATNGQLFKQYCTLLGRNIADPNDQESVTSLTENSVRSLLSESLAGISPISSLIGPVIRKLWPKYTLRGAVRTNITKGPIETYVWTRPFIETADSSGKPVRKYLPMGLRDTSGTYSGIGDLSKNIVDAAVSFNAAGGKVVDFWGTAASNGLSREPVVSHTSAIKYQPLDPVVGLDDIKVTLTGLFSDSAATVAAGTVKLSIGKQFGINGNASYTFSIDLSKYYTAANTAATGTLSGIVIASKVDDADTDFHRVLVTVVETEALDGATFVVDLSAKYSTEYNENAPTVQFDTPRYDVRIGTGEHINATLPVERLADMGSIYSLDGVALATDVITKIFATKVDQEILDLLRTSFVNQPGSGEFSNYPDATTYVTQFNVMPAVGYAGGPSAWREELKKLVDNLAARIQVNTYLNSGIFAVVGNPIDIQLITNINWSFRQGSAVDGVAVDYSVGTYQGGAGTYKVISSQIVPQGWIYVDFIPADTSQRTYDYFAYTFSVEAGYRDPNHANTPSIMLTKRDTVHEFMPAIAAIKIIGNDIGAGYNPFRDVLPISGSTSGTAVPEGNETPDVN